GLYLVLAAEEAECFAGGHPEHVGDALAAILHGEDFLAIPRAAALAAPHIDVGHELHIDVNVPFALTNCAAAAIDVEAEMAGGVVVRAGLDRLGKDLANWIERLDI